jgi:uncharacterized repeat protein (TIGR01451 family)
MTADLRAPTYSARKWTRPMALLGAAAVVGISSHVAAQEREIAPSASRQIQQLLEEKASRTPAQQKMSSDLLLNPRSARGSAMAPNLPELRSDVQVDTSGETLVDIKGEVTDALMARIEEVGGQVVNSFPQFGSVRAKVPIDRMEDIAELDEVRSIRSAEQYQLQKINTSEGDVAHRADVERTALGVDGSGIRVGVISDSVEALASLQGSGDLPAVVQVLPGQAGTGTSEGSAMLEIVHDLAPGATLLFATANGGQAQFAQNILDLRAAGADVLVDDVAYFAEPVFQDGIIAQAVEQVVADGAQYYSSAGNSGNLNDGTSGVWEGDFAATPPPLPLTGLGDAHDFGGGMNFNLITLDSPSLFTLQWSDPQGGSGNDYDLFLLNHDMTQVLASSTDVQNGDDDPFEAISSRAADDSNINDTGNVLVILRRPGAAARHLHLNTNRGRLQIATAGQTSGHSAAANAFSVAAVNVGVAGGGPFVGGPANPVERFSSDGPRRIFFEADGTPVTPGNVLAGGGTLRAKPDVAAADGVSTATPGFTPFFGTSAAAPHAAAIAALMLQRDPTLSPAAARALYASTALDIEAAGADHDSGVGLIDAVATLEALGQPSLEVVKTNVDQAGAVAYKVTVHNAGAADAANVVITEVLPDGATLLSTEGCAEDKTGVPTCTLGAIPAGGSKEYMINVAVTSREAGLLDNPPLVTTRP